MTFIPIQFSCAYLTHLAATRSTMCIVTLKNANPHAPIDSKTNICFILENVLRII